MGSTTHPYQIPVILTDLPPAEALNQAFDSLQQLDAVINDVFTKIAQRIKNERTKLASATARISTAQQKIQLISQNQTRVTTIFSTAKYPILKDAVDFQRSVGYDGLQPMSVPVTHTPARITSQQRSIPPANVDTTSLFQALPVSRTIRSAAITQQQQTNDAEGHEGLGRLPSYLPSVSSILLFNTDENPYKKYVSVNNLEGTGGKDRAKDGTGPSAAPQSVLSGAELPSFSGFQFGYKPELGPLPTLNLPQNLPLARIADLQYGAPTQVSSIAPSVGNFSSLLPTFETLALPAPTRAKERVSTVPTSSGATTLPAPVSAAPPPPQPASIPVAPAAPIPQAPPTAPVLAPDAPPPPPMDSVPEAPSAPPAASSGDGRSDLLAAIRGAGLKVLKKTKGGGGGTTARRKAKDEGEERPKPAAEPGGGDLMSALRDRLKRRHEAISGKQSTIPENEEKRNVIRAPTLGKLNLPRLEDDDTKSVAGSVMEEGEEPENKPSGMPSNVMSALMNAHNKKKAAEEGDWHDE